MDIFHIWFDVQIVIFVWKDEKNEKETEDGQFKKLLVTVFELQVYGKQNNNSCQLYNERQMSRYLDTYFNKLWRNQKIFTKNRLFFLSTQTPKSIKTHEKKLTIIEKQLKNNKN